MIEDSYENGEWIIVHKSEQEDEVTANSEKQKWTS